MSRATHLEQRMGFAAVLGGRVAYSTMGQGPALVFPPAMLAQLGLESDIEPMREFFEAFAAHFTLIRYDRLGAGFSDRHRPPETVNLQAEVEVIDALADELGLESFDLFGHSYGGCVSAAYAARRPERVRRLILFGSWANSMALTPREVQESLLSMFRADWRLGSWVLAEVVVCDGDAKLAGAFARFIREAVDAEVAATLFNLCYRTDVRDQLASITAPTLVLHGRQDHVSHPALGRELAALIPGARLELLEGRGHQPWLGEPGPVLGATGDFLGVALQGHPALSPPESAANAVLTTRETDVLRLVAEGLNDNEIAERLFLSRHTVHRHVANIRNRMGQSSRAAAAAHATRLSLI